MTESQRVKVVELLRCAADADGPHDLVGMPIAGYRLGYVDFVNHSKRVYVLADDVLGEIDPSERGDSYRQWLLEAALRVELREWP